MPIGTPVVGTLAESAAATTTSVPWPASVPAGALAVLVGSIKSTSATATTTPGGWTQRVQQAIAASTILPSVYIATMNAATTGSEGGTNLTVTHTSFASAYQIIVIPGANVGTPLDVAAFVADPNVASAATTFSSYTAPVTNGVLGLMVAGINSTTANATPPTQDGGWTETADRTGANTASIEVAYVAGISAGHSTTISNTWNQTLKNIGALIWVRPLVSVTATRATSWTVIGTASSTRATSWTTAGSAVATRASSWSVLGAVASVRATSWATLAAAVATRATSWTVRASAAASRATSWAVLGSAVATRATTWRTLAAVVGSRATSWATLAQATATRATSWNVLASLASVTATRSTVWNVVASVASTRPTSWTVRTPTTGTRSTAWTTRASATSTRSSAWSALSSATATRSTAWAVMGRVSAVRSALWNTLTGVVSSRSTSWSVAAAGPIFFVAGRLLPQRLRGRLLGQRLEGTIRPQRLTGHLED